MATVALSNVKKSYGEVNIIQGVDLAIQDREFVVFVGPSGCGKSTLLRMIAGLEEITSGDLSIDGKVVNDVPPDQRGLAMVFQSYALYPHMSVEKNMGFALKLAGVPQAERDAKVMEAARILQLEKLLDRKPGQLSGGQRQRVAIGRAIVRQPKVFLFDEPLSNLDASLRVQMRIEIARLHNELDATMIYVTHDQVEAMTMADRIVVLRAGKIEQVGTPLELYHYPVNTFVAGFIGSPKMNLTPAKLKKMGPDGSDHHAARRQGDRHPRAAHQCGGAGHRRDAGRAARAVRHRRRRGPVGHDRGGRASRRRDAGLCRCRRQDARHREDRRQRSRAGRQQGVGGGHHRRGQPVRQGWHGHDPDAPQGQHAGQDALGRFWPEFIDWI